MHAVYDNPSREDLPAYREYTASIERLGSDIDDEFGTDDWTPLILEIVEDYPARWRCCDAATWSSSTRFGTA